MPKGQQRILIKKGPHFWALALAFVVQVPTSLSTPLEGEGAGKERRAKGGRGGDLPSMHSWPLQSGPFQLNYLVEMLYNS